MFRASFALLCFFLSAPAFAQKAYEFDAPWTSELQSPAYNFWRFTDKPTVAPGETPPFATESVIIIPRSTMKPPAGGIAAVKVDGKMDCQTKEVSYLAEAYTADGQVAPGAAGAYEELMRVAPLQRNMSKSFLNYCVPYNPGLYSTAVFAPPPPPGYVPPRRLPAEERLLQPVYGVPDALKYAATREAAIARSMTPPPGRYFITVESGVDVVVIVDFANRTKAGDMTRLSVFMSGSRDFSEYDRHTARVNCETGKFVLEETAHYRADHRLSQVHISGDSEDTIGGHTRLSRAFRRVCAKKTLGLFDPVHRSVGAAVDEARRRSRAP